MDKNLDLIAKELFGKIRTQFPKVQLGDGNSKVTDRPQDARFFEFDYVKNNTNLGTISVSLSDDDGIVILYSNDIVDDQPSLIKKQWFRFLRGMRDFAKARLLNFSIRDIAKTNLDKRDYKFLSNNSGEAAMTESKLWGTSKTSFQNMGEAKLIVKHSRPVNYDLPAGRTMHIENIFIENAEGERFRYPYKHLNGARALATHVAAGGTSYDDIGQHIISLSEELNKLRMFKGYVDRHPVIAEAMDSINGKVFERIDQIKKEISNLQRPTYYQSFAENFTKREEKLIPEDVINDWVDRLTIRNFNEELKNVFPYIYNLVGEDVAPVVELTPEDLILAQEQSTGLELENELAELSDFESYLEQLVKEDNDLFNTRRCIR
jgi:FMN-dependent NADH-azoreductase